MEYLLMYRSIVHTISTQITYENSRFLKVSRINRRQKEFFIAESSRIYYMNMKQLGILLHLYEVH